GLALQLVAHRRERMLGDVQPEALLLHVQKIRLVELLRGEHRVLHLLRLVAEVKDRSLPEAARVVRGVAGTERLVEHLEHRLARPGQRARLDERLARAATIARHAFSPTFFTALRPNRILPSTTAKSTADSFTSGGSTSMPSSSQALT